MKRRAKVELFEQIRREYEFGAGTIKGIARKLGVHRRMVRQALADAQPPERKRTQRERPVVGPLVAFIDAILEADRKSRLTPGLAYLGDYCELSVGTQVALNGAAPGGDRIAVLGLVEIFYDNIFPILGWKPF